ncbi:hypothetical protein N7462_000431 [Penicillium macrosclerotiorum]|uniref:uncharacterized protein n=1 Tax=Penicillium macrosclerotiorum TaxID=303699 RepID=UPI0025483F8C|nr:uncharacterized protein N7462_000431 [Penicillium macrosclerotiorum]KAJ5698426.1 hypothetical protein N7462_000431 [Penicillium macrosclerotiorum]
MAENEITAAQHLLSIIQSRLTGRYSVKTPPIYTSKAPKPILPRKLNKLQFLKIDAKEIARQLTLMEANLFSKIQADELLKKGRQKSDSSNTPEPAANIKASIRFFNQLSNWVGTLILAESDLKKRAHVIGHIVDVANACLNLQNYSAVISILSSFESAPIYRLVRTWAMVTERTCNVLKPMQMTTSSAQNYHAYRETLRVAVPPCIPFLGLFLKDLTFTRDGNPSLTPEGLINFSKCTLLASTIQEFQRFREASYSLQPVPELQEFLATQLQSASELHDMWDRSCELESRGREDNRRRDLYTPTGGMTTAMVIACMVLDD